MSLTRARSPSSKNGLPDLRLLPDAPVPDGRTVLTSPDADRRAAGRGSRKASAAFHTRYQHRREPAHADPQDDQDQRTLPQRRRRAAADLARDTARQDELANLLQLDERNGSPTHPLRRPRPRQHLTTHRYTEKRAGSAAQETRCSPLPKTLMSMPHAAISTCAVRSLTPGMVQTSSTSSVWAAVAVSMRASRVRTAWSRASIWASKPATRTPWWAVSKRLASASSSCGIFARSLPLASWASAAGSLTPPSSASRIARAETE